MYPVMQAYGSLALEDNLEVGEAVLGRCSIFLHLHAPVPSSSQPKKQIHSLQWVLLGEDLVISPTLELWGLPVQVPIGPIAKGHGLVLGSLLLFLRATLVT